MNMDGISQNNTTYEILGSQTEPREILIKEEIKEEFIEIPPENFVELKEEPLCTKEISEAVSHHEVWSQGEVIPELPMSESCSESVPGPSRILTEYERARQRVQEFNEENIDDAVIFLNCIEDGTISEFGFESDEEKLYRNGIQPQNICENKEELISQSEEIPNIEVEIHDEDANENGLAPANFIGMRSKKQTEEYNWRKADFIEFDSTWKQTLSVDDSWYGKPPAFFFNLMFGDNLISHITLQTKIYALQKDDKEFDLSEEQMKTFLGILMVSGIIKVPTYRTYWKSSLRITAIADAMSRDKFEKIKRYLHFNDNEMEVPKDEPGHDKLYKIRPIIESVKANCRKIPQEEHQSVDEQIIPTKTRNTLKHYNSKTIHKWGYKVISRAGTSGCIYDFEIYTGKDTVYKDEFGLGFAPNFVIRLVENVPKHCNFKIYFDNWFSSVKLVKKLKDYGMLSIATIRPNRIKSCSLKTEKELKKEGRGSFDYRVDTTNNILGVKWLDTKPVHLISSYMGINPISEAIRWDRKGKKRINVPKPRVLEQYNKCMGGVDLADMLMELYRIDFKSKKWYMRIFFYFLDLSVTNAWILYRRTLNGKENKIVSLREFKEDIALALINCSLVIKRGRPSMDNSSSLNKRMKSAHPPDSSRMDNMGHFPGCVPDKKRCKMCVKGFSRVICEKCNVGLCLTNKKNCFKEYHIKKI